MTKDDYKKEPFFSILTRTSGRPNYFSNCCASINRQTYSNFSHLVCTDDADSIEYVKSNGIVPMFMYHDGSKLGRSVKHSFYNIYFNKMYPYVNDGYVMFLDDDDMFTRNDSLEILASVISAADSPESTLFLWQVLFPNGILVPTSTTDLNFKPGNLSGIGFCFHTNYINTAIWDEYKESDFRVIHKLKIACDKVLVVPMVLTGVQRGAGWGGFGGRDDIGRSA
jgi:hypothetical protein